MKRLKLRHSFEELIDYIPVFVFSIVICVVLICTLVYAFTYKPLGYVVADKFITDHGYTLVVNAVSSSAFCSYDIDRELWFIVSNETYNDYCLGDCVSVVEDRLVLGE